ncbi:MAG: 3-phosphoshikimate 1-carboxyvinyltransferase [Pseudomonadota bacterium]
MAASPYRALARRSPGLKGEARAPGDKSISHRAILFAAMAAGESEITGLLEGEDVLRTAAAMRAFGRAVEREAGVWRVSGGDWSSPERVIYCGNSGTSIRLISGAAAGRGVAMALDGDASLRARPMERVAEPLRALGAVVRTTDGKAPVTIEPAALIGVDYVSPKASAQVKSAVLLAGLSASGSTSVTEPTLSRDHTERMLAAMGAVVESEELEGGARRARVVGGDTLRPASLRVPGDPSSAAFLMAAAAISPGSDVIIRDVCLNPTRTGFITTLQEMGAAIDASLKRTEGGEPVGDVRVASRPLRGVAVPPERAASMIDEYPILAVVAACADGPTRMAGVGELRVKESDRIAAMEEGLRAQGVETASGEDWLEVRGAGRPPRGGGEARTRLDHRIAMSFVVLGLATDEPVEIDDASPIATSFPSFFEDMLALGARLERVAA